MQPAAPELLRTAGGERLSAITRFARYETESSGDAAASRMALAAFSGLTIGVGSFGSWLR